MESDKIFKKPLPSLNWINKSKRHHTVSSQQSSGQTPSNANEIDHACIDEGPCPEDITPMSSKAMEAEALQMGRHRLPLQIMPLRPKPIYRPPPVNDAVQLMTVYYNGETITKYVSATGSWDDSLQNTTAGQPKRQKTVIAPNPGFNKNIVSPEELKQTNSTPTNKSAFRAWVPAMPSLATLSKECVQKQTIRISYPYWTAPAVPKNNQSDLIFKNYAIGPRLYRSPPPLLPVTSKKVLAARLVPLYVTSTTRNAATPYRLKVIPVLRPLNTSNFQRLRVPPPVTQRLQANTNQILPIRATLVRTVQWSKEPPPLTYTTLTAKIKKSDADEPTTST